MNSLQAVVAGRIGALYVDAQIDTGDGTLVIVGPNGAGKTTLLLMLLGIRRPHSGRITVGESKLLDTAANLEVAVENRRLGYVPQDYGLFPHLTVLENVEFALECDSTGRQRKSRRIEAEAILDHLDLMELTARQSSELSGGEKQKVALARALAAKPQALLLDEPLGALDVAARHDVRLFLAAYLKKLDIPAIVVTHDPNEARTLGDRLAVLEAGRIAQAGTWEELCEQPATTFVQQLVSRM